MLTLLCGMQSEAEIFEGHPDLLVLHGAARDNLSIAVPKGCRGLISAGTCGGLVHGISRGDLVIGTSVTTAKGTIYLADKRWAVLIDQKLATAGLGRVYSDPNTITLTPLQRAALYRQHRVAVNDEESWAVAQAAFRLSLPFVVLRAVSDQWDQTLLPDDAKAVNTDGTINVGPLIPDILENPAEALLEGQGLAQALSALRQAFNALGPTFGFA